MFHYFNKLKKYIVPIMLLVFVFITLAPVFAHAGSSFDPSSLEIKGSWWDKLTCSVGDIGNCINMVIGWVLNAFLSVVGLILALCAFIFELVLKVTVLNFGAWKDNEAIIQGWTVMRDTGNVFFIFILLYIAIGTILELHSVDAKKAVTHLVIIALLVNFSGVFARIIIDASNITATYYYNEAKKVHGDDLSASVMNALKIATVSGMASSETGLAAAVDGLDDFFGQIVGVIGGIIFILLTSFILLAAALFFVARAVKLLFLILTSPAAFIASIIPKYGDQISSYWWGTLGKEAVFAPAFMLLFSLSIKVADAAAGSLGTSDQSAIIDKVVYFIIVIGLMFGSLMIANKMGAFGAGAAEKMAGGALAAAGIATGAYLGRSTLGRAAERMRTSERFKDIKDRVPFGGLMDKGLKKVAGSGFGGGSSASFVKVREERMEARKKKAEEAGKLDPYREQQLRERGEAAAKMIEAQKRSQGANESDADYAKYEKEIAERAETARQAPLKAAKEDAANRQREIVEKLKAGGTEERVAAHEFEESQKKSKNKTAAYDALKKRIEEQEKILVTARALFKTKEDAGTLTLQDTQSMATLENEFAQLKTSLAQMEASDQLLKNTKKDDHAPKSSSGGHAPAATHPPAAPGGASH